jgi:hypothetical protein
MFVIFPKHTKLSAHLIHHLYLLALLVAFGKGYNSYLLFLNAVLFLLDQNNIGCSF